MLTVPAMGLDEYASLVNGVTGETHNAGTLKELARRTITLERLFNGLCGFTDKDDWLPDRFYNQSIHTKDGQVICDREGFRKMHLEYYRSVGWDDSGKPTRKTLQTLELVDFLPPDSADIQ